MKKFFFIIIIFIVILIAGIIKWFFTAPEKPKITPYNILYINSDSFNKKRLSIYGNTRSTTPFIDAFSKKGIVFDKMINPSGWTNENLVSIFTSLYSPVHGVNTRGKNIDPKWKTPLEILRDYGYAIPRLEGWQADQNHSFLGFDEVAVMAPEIWLDKHISENPTQPFFLFYQFLNTHLPYNCAEDTSYLHTFFSDTMFINKEQRDRIRNSVMTNSVIPKGSIQFKPEDIPIIRALYDNEVRLLDSMVKKLIEKLENLGLEDSTIIVISADHGEELLEHGFVGHASTSKTASLYDELVNVPFIISFPKKLPAGKRINTQVRGIDVIPTILELIGIPRPDYLQGKSLLPIIDGKESDRTAYAESSREGYGAKNPENIIEFIRMVRTPDWKLIHYIFTEDYNRFELFHLPDDTDEQKNVINEYPDIAAKLKDDLLKWLVQCKEMKPPVEDNLDYISPYQQWKHKRALMKKKIDWSKVPSPTRWISFKDGDTINYNSFEGKAVFAWTGLENVPYIIEYEAGKGTYYLNGTISIFGNQKIYGPFKKDYWNNFLTHYSPIKVRVSIDKKPYKWSNWVTLNVGKVE